MTQLYTLWDPTVQFQSRSGKNLVNGLIEVTYLDRTELAPVYDFEGKTVQNPITLDENGRAAVYVEVDKLYTIHVYDQNRQLVYTQNIREYPKDVTVTVPTIVAGDGIDVTQEDTQYSISIADDAKNTADYFASGSGTKSVKGPFKSMRSDSSTTGLTSDMFDSEGTLIGHLIPKYGTPGQVLKSTYTNVYWSDEASASNILVLDYGDTSKSLDDMKSYDTVLVTLNAKTFYLVDLDDSRAWFASSYVIEGKPMLETVRYFADKTWDAISTLDFRKVSVDKSSTSGFLEDVLVSDSDTVSLVKADSKLHVQVNTDDIAKVASQAGQTPGYLSEVIKAGQNITVTEDGAYVTIASTASGGSSMQLSFVASKDTDFVTSYYLVNTNVADHQLSVQVSSLYADSSAVNAFDGYWQYTCELDYCLVTVKLPDTFTWRVSGKYDRVADGVLVTLHQGQTVVLHQYYDTLTIDTGEDVSTSTSLANSSNDLTATDFSIIASSATKKR